MHSTVAFDPHEQRGRSGRKRAFSRACASVQMIACVRGGRMMIGFGLRWGKIDMTKVTASLVAMLILRRPRGKVETLQVLRQFDQPAPLAEAAEGSVRPGSGDLRWHFGSGLRAVETSACIQSEPRPCMSGRSREPVSRTGLSACLHSVRVHKLAPRLPAWQTGEALSGHGCFDCSSSRMAFRSISLGEGATSGGVALAWDAEMLLG